MGSISDPKKRLLDMNPCTQIGSKSPRDKVAYWLATIQESLATCRHAKTPKSTTKIATHLPNKSHESLAICKRTNQSKWIPPKLMTSYRESAAILPKKSAKSLAPTLSSMNPHLRPPRHRDLNRPWRNKSMKPYKEKIACLSKGKTMKNP